MCPVGVFSEIIILLQNPQAVSGKQFPKPLFYFIGYWPGVGLLVPIGPSKGSLLARVRSIGSSQQMAHK